MTRVFAAARKFQKEEQMTRWEDFVPLWESFFPDRDRRAMYAWAPIAGSDAIEDMCWLMQELTNVLDEQHQLRPHDCCCFGPLDVADTTTITRPAWLQESERLYGSSSASQKKRMTLGEGYTIPNHHSRTSDSEGASAAAHQQLISSSAAAAQQLLGGGGSTPSDDGAHDADHKITAATQRLSFSMRQSQRFRRLQREEIERCGGRCVLSGGRFD
jgi:hypothetical protein